MKFGRRDARQPSEDEPEFPASDQEGDTGAAAPDDPWAVYDATRDWREDGPFDIDEVDLDADDVDRLDLGVLVITPVADAQIQILADQATGQGLAVLLEKDGAAIQVSVFAAPQSGGLAAETRRELLAAAEAQGGRAELAEGPFGTELRRILPAVDASGTAGMAAFRDWFVEGPRWMLNGRLVGAAAIDVTSEGRMAVIEDFFRNIVVRRGDAAMVPGSILPLTIPQAQG